MLPRNSMNCGETLTWLQSRLDGGFAPMPAGVATHASECSECRGRIRAAKLLIGHLAPRLPRHRATPLLTERIISAVHRDARRQHIGRWAATGAALAAAIVLAVWLSVRALNTAKPGEGMALAPMKAPSLRAEFVGAGDAVASLTKRTASETLGESRLLVPKIEVPKFVTASWSLATAPLDSTGKGIADGLEPVATSARRAVNLFLRDTPAIRVDGDKKN
jgi:predicted anti-sigma-YlaC factor YlaD